jgi:amino acid transporter
MIELAVVIALAITFLGFAVAENKFTIAPLTLGASKDGWRGVFLALPMGLMCMVCDAAVPAGEETRNARRTIPIAIVLTCAIVGIWYMVGFSAFAMARTTADIPVSSIQNGIAPMAARVWGPWKILVSLTAMTASLGAFIPIVTASSRMIFALARKGKLPTALARLHPEFLAPWNAIHIAFAVTLLGISPVFICGPNDTIDWWGSTMGWFIGIVYAAANIVNIVYYWRCVRSQFHPLLNFVVPASALVVQIWVIWQSAIVALWDAGPLGHRAQAFMLGTTLAVTCYSIFMRNRFFASATPEL